MKQMKQLEKMKKILRNKHISIRKNMDKAVRKAANASIYELLINHPDVVKSRNIMLYASTEDEVSTRELATHLLKENKNIFFPVIEGDKIKIAGVNKIEDLCPGRFNIDEPCPEKRKYEDPNMLDLVIVPGVSFTPDGTRLGRGGGYYDRFLNNISEKTKAIGICYKDNIETELPADSYDISVDEVVTDKI
jgi:5-formyltetrahydrofolate cyclo-ligase